MLFNSAVPQFGSSAIADSSPHEIIVYSHSRRYSLILSVRFFCILILFALSGWAQSAPTPANMAKSADDATLNQRIENTVRAHFKVPARIAVAVSGRKPSNLPGYDSVTVTLSSSGHTSPHDFLLSKDGNKLAQLNEIDISKDPFAVDGRPTRGAQDAKVKVVVYDDFQCPYCARGHQTLFSEIFPEYKDKILIVYKDFPLFEIHPWAIHAAVDANCLAAQNNDAYWDFADYVHGHQAEIRGQERPLADQFSSLDHSAIEYGQKHSADMNRLQACVKAQDESAVRASAKYGEDTLGVDSTPTLFINGAKLDGAVPAEELRKTLNVALLEAGVSAPANAASTSPKPLNDAGARTKTAAPPSPVGAVKTGSDSKTAVTHPK